MLGTKIYFFSTFASAAGNPDPEACWVAAGDRQVYPDEVEDADMVDYGELFREWFAYGAVLFMVAILLQIIAMVTASAGTAASGVLRVTRLLQVIHFLFYLAWLYYGVQCRFSEGGRVAAPRRGRRAHAEAGVAVELIPAKDSLRRRRPSRGSTRAKPRAALRRPLRDIRAEGRRFSSIQAAAALGLDQSGYTHPQAKQC